MARHSASSVFYVGSSKIYRKSIENLSKNYRTSIEHLWIRGGSWVDLLWTGVDIRRIWAELGWSIGGDQNGCKSRKTMFCVFCKHMSVHIYVGILGPAFARAFRPPANFISIFLRFLHVRTALHDRMAEHVHVRATSHDRTSFSSKWGPKLRQSGDHT